MPEYLTEISEIIKINKPMKKYKYLYTPLAFFSLLDESKKQTINEISGIKIGIPNLLLNSITFSL